MSIDKLEPFEIFKYLIKEKKPSLWMTGWLYVIPTSEIDLESEGITMSDLKFWNFQIFN